MKMGDHLRSVRRQKKLTVQRVAEMAKVSKSFLSQIENNQAKPSVSTLKRITETLGIRVAELFLDQPPDQTLDNSQSAGNGNGKRRLVRVVGMNKRKVLRWPESNTLGYLLTPDLKRKLEVILGENQPGDQFSYEPYEHEGEEFGLVLSGRYEVTVDNQAYVLEEGDSIYYPSHLPHRMRVLGDKPAVTLWVIPPPSF